MTLIKPTQQHITTLMGWFNNKEELVSWGGPLFSGPFTSKCFLENLNLNQFNSYSLVSNTNEIIGFGQFYQHLNKCHISRLIIKPESRGKGFASILISNLMHVGMKTLTLNSCSLFVYKHNKAAISVYQKLGFELTEYPNKSLFQDCLYMVNVNFIELKHSL